ncbi:Response regulatory domain-containing protein, partial [Dysosmobacter welbionis]
GQLADVQVLSGNDQRSHAGGHDDAGLVEPLHVLHS